MTIAMTTNILTMVLCLAVLVQSVRMMRNLRKVKDGALTQVVTALEKATAEARTVLSEMKGTLGDCAETARTVAQARALRDELETMIGIADGACERIVAAVSAANAARGVAAGDAQNDGLAEEELANAPTAEDEVQERNRAVAALKAAIAQAEAA